MKKKLIAVLLSILMVLLLFASCDTGNVEEVTSEPVSEISSIEVSSKTEEASSPSFIRHNSVRTPSNVALSLEEAYELISQYYQNREDAPKEYLCESNGWLEIINEDGSRNYYYGFHLFNIYGSGMDWRTYTVAWLWVDMNDGSIWSDVISYNGLPVLDY